jgi:hypothetical protein
MALVSVTALKIEPVIFKGLINYKIKSYANLSSSPPRDTSLRKLDKKKERVLPTL